MNILSETITLYLLNIDINVKFKAKTGYYQNIISFFEDCDILFMSTMKLDFTKIPFNLHGNGNSENIIEYLAKNNDNPNLIYNFLNYFITDISKIKYDDDQKLIFEFLPNENWQNLNLLIYKRFLPTTTTTAPTTTTTAPTTTTTTTTSPINILKLTYNNLTDIPVLDVNSLSDWNNYFELPTYGSPFDSIQISGNTVNLQNASTITLKNNIFGTGNTTAIMYNILKVEDTGCVISCLDSVFVNSIYGGCYNLTTVHLPNCTSLGNNVFNGCSSLNDLILPFNSYTTLGTNVFNNCSALNGYLHFQNVTSAGDSCFSYCSGLSGITMPNILTAGDYCFYVTVSISSYDYPLLVSGGTMCFAQFASSFASELQTVNLPEVLRIGDYCFYGDVTVNSIYMPKLINLGSTVGNDSVFYYVEGNSGTTLNLTIPAALMTCNDGITTFNPDGDILDIQSKYAGTLNIIQIDI
jgi:hypothetical protein